MQKRILERLTHAACLTVSLGVIGSGCGTIEAVDSGLDCPQGATSWCACPRGVEGVSTCLADGTWDTCDCPAPIPDTSSVAGPSCEPSCDGLECGSDGCGGTCGACGPGAVCADGACLCVPETVKGCIGGDVHWLDSCGGAGSLVEDCAQWCEDGACAGCTPDCEDRACGPDGCGGACGACTGGEACDEDSGQCACPGEPGPSCFDAQVVAVDGCGVIGEVLEPCDHGCAQGACLPCVSSCGDAECGDDGCGGTCGACGDGASCEDGACVCEPEAQTACVGGDVRWLDSCGQVGELLAACESFCVAGECVGCEAACGDAECGPDGCGGTCGSCEGGSVCDSGACVCAPDAGETCEGVDLWAYDSCGVSTHLVETCSSACGCQDQVALATGFLGLTDLCAGQALSVPFMASGPFQADNQFTVQLSNKLGSFVGAPPIGAAPGTTSGSVEVVIPSGLAPGDGYRMRIVASSPPVAGADNGEDLGLHAPPDPDFAIGAPDAWGVGFKASVGQAVAFFPAAGPDVDLGWSFGAGATPAGGSPAAPLVAYQLPGVKQISLTVTDPWGCQATRTVQTEADSVEVLPCNPQIPADAVATGTMTHWPASGPVWVCAGGAYTAGGGEGGLVFVEPGGTFTFTGGGDYTVYVRSGGTLVPDADGSSVVVYEPGAILGDIEFTDHVIACDALAFDTSEAQDPGCDAKGG